MKSRSLHLQEVENIQADPAENYCFLICKAPSGGSVDVRIPRAEARKLHAMLAQLLGTSEAAA